MKAVVLPPCCFPFAAAVRSIPLESRDRKVRFLRKLWLQHFLDGAKRN